MLSFLPDVDRNCTLDTKAVCSIDSTDMTPEIWMMIADAIKENYDDYDGFVVLHGTDTMAYTASALSFISDTEFTKADSSYRRSATDRLGDNRREDEYERQHHVCRRSVFQRSGRYL